MRILHNFFMAAIFSATVLFQTPAFAENIGVINIQQIMKESKAAKSVRDQLQKKQKDFQKELDDKQKQLLTEDKKLVEQRNKISQEAFEKKVKEFQGKAAQAQQAIQTKKVALDKAFAKALNQIQRKVREISEATAKEKKMDVVLAASQLVYANNALDITSIVLSKLNDALPSVTVSVE